MKYKIIIILTFLYHLALSQSVKDLIQEAAQNNFELKALENDYLSALEKAPQVSQLPDPEVGIGVFPLPVETRLGPQVLRVGLTQMFPWSGVLKNKEELEKAKALVKYEKVAARKLDLIYQIKKSYFQLYEIQKRKEILERNRALLNALEQLALAKVESGKGSSVDVLRVQLKIKELEQELIVLGRTERKPIIEINQILNRDLETPISTSDNLVFEELIEQKDSLLAMIRANHPAVKMLEMQVGVSTIELSLNRLNRKPTFGAGIDYIMVNERKNIELDHNGRDILQVRGTVKIPLSTKKYDAKSNEEQLKIEAINHQKENVVSQFEAIIEKAYTDHEIAKLKKELFEEQIEITKAAIRILETEYSAKGNRFDELLRLEQDLIDYDLKILKTIVESHLAKAEIERLIISN